MSDTNISNSVFSNNTAGIGGGAIEVRSVLNVSSSAFLDNSANTEGGAISNASRGTDEGIGTLSVTNSTFSGNSAGRGSAIATGIHGAGPDIGNAVATLTHITVSGNTSGSAVYNEDTLNIYNSIIYGNSTSDCAGTLNANTRNIIGTGNCSTAYSSRDPLLGSLLSRGNYFPLQSGSPAIDAADASRCPSRDQRGARRPAGGGCDIGAYEYGGSGGSGGSTPAQLQPTHVVSDQNTVQHNEQMIDEHGYDVDTEYGLQTISISPLPLGNCGAIGNMTVCAMELLEAVDVSGHAAQGIDFCFSQQGQVYFLPSHDANGVAINQQTAQPERLPVWLSDGKTCVTINRNGKLFLVQALMSALLQVAPPATSTPDLFAGMSTTADGYKVGTQHGMQTIAVAPLPIDNCGAIGNMAVCAMNILDAADVSGFAQQGIRFCFPQVGQILFLPSHDGNGMPIDQQAAQPETLTVELINGHTCVEINRTGKLILVQSDSPLQLQTAPQTVVIQDCDLPPQLVVGGWAIRRGFADINIRAQPSMAGNKVGAVGNGDIMRVLGGPVTADSYTWFRVETDSGETGWAAESNCDYWLSPHDGPTATSTPTPDVDPEPASEFQWAGCLRAGGCH